MAKAGKGYIMEKKLITETYKKTRIDYKHTRIFYPRQYDDLEWVAPGKTCILVGRTNIMSGAKWYELRHDTSGIGGNLNSSIKRYHGWRGTSYGISTDAYGLREILAVEVLKDDVYEGRTLRVTLSKDLHSEWD